MYTLLLGMVLASVALLGLGVTGPLQIYKDKVLNKLSMKLIPAIADGELPGELIPRPLLGPPEGWTNFVSAQPDFQNRPPSSGKSNNPSESESRSFEPKERRPADEGSRRADREGSRRSDTRRRERAGGRRTHRDRPRRPERQASGTPRRPEPEVPNTLGSPVRTPTIVVPAFNQLPRYALSGMNVAPRFDQRPYAFPSPRIPLKSPFFFNHVLQQPTAYVPGLHASHVIG